MKTKKLKLDQQEKIIGVLITMAMLFVISGCQGIVGSKEIVQEVRELPPFDGVSVGGSIDLFITQSDDILVELEADDNIIDHIFTRVENGILHIGIEQGYSIMGSATMQAYVTAPYFLSIKASGSSDIKSLTPIVQESLVVTSSGSSDVVLEIWADYLELSCSGSSDARLKGEVHSADIRLSGSSDMKGYDLLCHLADVRLSGSSDLHIKVIEKVKGHLSGASDLYVKGDAIIDVSTSGSSSVKRVK